MEEELSRVTPGLLYAVRARVDIQVIVAILSIILCGSPIMVIQFRHNVGAIENLFLALTISWI